MKVIAIDPGYDRVGVAILVKHEKEELIFSTCITTNKKDSFYERLLVIKNTLDQIITDYQPDYFVFEEIYFSNNTKTALKVAEARGVISSTALAHHIPIYELHPNHVKIAITGHGGAKKSDILWMLPKLIPLDVEKKLDDELDAIAIGLAFFAQYRTLKKLL
jgi:crossover junction endodeoxyribonuclease RuvC